MKLSAIASCAATAVCAVLLLSYSVPPVQSINLPRHAQGISTGAVAHWEKPWFYHDLEGPKFKVVSRPDTIFEERRYESGVWVSTNYESISYSIAIAASFKKLYGYISGANSMNQTLAMTVPVKVKIMAGQGPFCTNTFTTSFWVPAFKQDNVPKPDNKDVFIDHTPAKTVYVTSFGGFALDPIIVLKARAAISRLQSLNISVSTKYFQTAGYDAPYTLLNRHNEIWIPAAGDDVAQA